MKKIVLTSLFALFLAFPVFAQDEVETVTLPDAVMKQVVKQIIGRYFKPRAMPKEIRIYAKHIKAEWLPTIRNVKFALVTEESEVVGSSIYAFGQVERKGREFNISFGYGNPNCSMIGDVFYFYVVKGIVRSSGTTGGYGSDCFAGGSKAPPKL